MFNREHKSVTTKTVQGSASSSTVTRTVITSNTTFHSQSSSTQFKTSIDPRVLVTTSHIKQSPNVDPRVLETTSRIEQLSIKQSPNVVTSRKEDNLIPPKSGTVPTSTVKSIEQFQLDCLNAHNECRKRHGVGPLKLSPTLSTFAQNWANTIAKKRQLQHSSEKKYGENIYWSSGSAVNGKAAVDSWYNEVKQYNYKNASFSSGTGHFTQVVWKNSCDLGVGMACVGNEVYVVASYYPPGNFSGEFSKNVFPPK